MARKSSNPAALTNNRNSEDDLTRSNLQYGANFAGNDHDDSSSDSDHSPATADAETVAIAQAAMTSSTLVSSDSSNKTANLYEKDDKGKITLRYHLLVHDNLPEEFSEYFVPKDYVSKFSPLWSKLKSLKFANASTTQDKALTYTLFYKYLAESDLDIFLDPTRAPNLDYSHVVVKTEIATLRDLLSLVLPDTAMAAIHTDTLERTYINFSKGLNKLWGIYDIFQYFHTSKVVHDPTTLTGLAYLAPVVHVQSPEEIDTFYKTIFNFVTKNIDMEVIKEKIPTAKWNKLTKLSGLEFIVSYCLEYKDNQVAERLRAVGKGGPPMHVAPYTPAREFNPGTWTKPFNKPHHNGRYGKKRFHNNRNSNNFNNRNNNNNNNNGNNQNNRQFNNSNGRTNQKPKQFFTKAYSSGNVSTIKIDKSGSEPEFKLRSLDEINNNNNSHLRLSTDNFMGPN